MTARRHCETVDLGLDVDDLLGVRFQPGDIDLDVEMTDAVTSGQSLPTYSMNTMMTYFDTIASSGIASKCLAVMMSLLPVVVTNTFARGAASSMVVTSYPAIAA